MRIVFVPATLVIFACFGASLVHAETKCLENALPMETLGSDAEQREVFLLQAKACGELIRKAKYVLLGC